MYLLITALVAFSGNADAFPTYQTDPLPMPSGGCGTRPPPCTGIYTGDYSIVPSDWYDLEQRTWGGYMNYFRVEVFTMAGEFDVEFGGRLLSEAYYSEKESGRTDVYYVPAFAGATVGYRSYGREEAVFELVVTGAMYEGL